MPYKTGIRLLGVARNPANGFPARLLVALAGFECGEVPGLIRNYRDDEALSAARFYREIFGEDFYLEVCRRPDSKSDGSLRRLVAFAREGNIPLVAANAVHYLDDQDAPTAALREAISQQVPLERFLTRRGERSLVPSYIMAERFGDLPEALLNARQISERCSFTLPLGSWRAPDIPRLSGALAEDQLTRLVYQSAAERCPNMNPTVCSRLEEELGVIRGLGMATVFLVAHDLAKTCVEREIRSGRKVQLRGSAVNSLVLFALGVSNVDPIDHNLVFERFLHLNKPSLPDIDLDVQRSRRLEVRDFIIERYGAERVATLGTITTYHARSLLRDAAPVLGLPKDVVFGALEGVYGQPLQHLLELAASNPELKGNRLLRHQKVRRALEKCAPLDGLPARITAHPSGLVIGPSNLEQWVPLEARDGTFITQYPADAIEEMGILKIDLLSSPTLDVLEEARILVLGNQGEDPSTETERRDDPEVFALHRNGESIGCFQVESPLQQELAERLRPQEFSDLATLLALGRPGPMRARLHEEYLRRRNGGEHLLDDPAGLKDCLVETHGILLYQEQTLQIAHHLANFSYGDADLLYRFLTQAGRAEEKLDLYREQFLTGASDNGMDRETGTDLWKYLAQGTGYAFPKGHAVAYAGLAYEALWLKRYYPAELLCALMNHQPCGSYPPRVLMMEARRLGIGLKPLDVNASSMGWTVENGTLRVGLRQLKGMTDSGLRRIVLAQRERPFIDFEDFVLRTWLPNQLVENLVLAGAFDRLEADRDGLVADLPVVLRRRRKAGRYALGFPGRSGSPGAPRLDSSRRDRMLWEFGLLGFCTTGTPFELMREDIKELTSLQLLASTEPGQLVSVAGSVIRRHASVNRNGQRTVFLTLEDGTGMGNIVVFSNAQIISARSLMRESWLLVEGIVQDRGPAGRSVIANRAEPLQVRVNRGT